jgi:thiol:disulfide interchange protein DsbA
MITLSKSKRAFLSIAIFGFTVSFSGLAAAQSPKIEEGFDYRILPMAQPVEAKGKVEVHRVFLVRLSALL